MNKEILKWYLNYIDNKKLNENLNKLKLNINGFCNNRKSKSRSIIPTQIAIKNILEDEGNYNKVTKYFFEESFLEVNGLKDSDIMDLLKEGKDIEGILKFLVGSNEDIYLEEKKYLLEKIKSGTLNLEGKNIENSKKSKSSVNKEKNSIIEPLEGEEELVSIEKSKVEDINKLRNKIEKLENSNKKLNSEIEKFRENKKTINNEKIALSKQINILTQEVTSLKRKLETSQKRESNINKDFASLKNKYDDLLNREKELLKKNIDLKEERINIRKKEEQLKEKNKELISELENIKRKLDKIPKKKIAIIGEIDKIHLKGSNYEFEKIMVKNTKNLDDLLQDYEEVWVNLYQLSSLEQSKILRVENNYKVFKFKRFEEVKNRINNGI